MLMVPPGKEEPLDDESEIQLERLALHTAAHYVYHLLCQLEMRSLKSQIIGRRNIQDKTEIYVHQKTFLLID